MLTHPADRILQPPLYRVAEFAPLAIAGSLDVAKGAVGPAVAGSERPRLAASAALIRLPGASEAD